MEFARTFITPFGPASMMTDPYSSVTEYGFAVPDSSAELGLCPMGRRPMNMSFPSTEVVWEREKMLTSFSPSMVMFPLEPPRPLHIPRSLSAPMLISSPAFTSHPFLETYD